MYIPTYMDHICSPLTVLLSQLIAKYGGAANTSCINPAWTVWCYQKTGAATRYIPQNSFVVTFRNPLCKPKQIPYVIHIYLYFLSHDKNLKSVWCCVDTETEKVLVNEFRWSSITVVSEERINLTRADLEKCDKNLRKKLYCTEKNGIKLTDVTGLVDPEVKKEIDEYVEGWKCGKKGTQVHLTGVTPWGDDIHHRYFSTWDVTDNICTMVVFTQLSVSWLPDQVGIGVPWCTAGNN